LEVVTGEIAADSGAAAPGATNPFAPRIGSGNRQGRGSRL